MNRRTFLRTAGVMGFATAAGPLVSVARAQTRTLKIGYIGAQSGMRANFGETTPWAIERIRPLVKDGLKIGGKTYPVELVFKDNQSDPNRSSVVASELILREKCDLILCFDADAAAAAGGAGRHAGHAHDFDALCRGRAGSSRAAPPRTTSGQELSLQFHFFWGADEVVKNFLPHVEQWSTPTRWSARSTSTRRPDARSPTRRSAWPAGWRRTATRNSRPAYSSIATDDFTNQVSAFKNAGAEIVSGLASATHWATFWNQAAQAGFRPQICTVAAAFLFPSAVNALGIAATACRPKCGGRRSFRSSPRSPGRRRASWPRNGRSRPASSGPSRIGYAHAHLGSRPGRAASAADPKDKDSLRDAIANLRSTPSSAR